MPPVVGSTEAPAYAAFQRFRQAAAFWVIVTTATGLLVGLVLIPNGRPQTHECRLTDVVYHETVSVPELGCSDGVGLKYKCWQCNPWPTACCHNASALDPGFVTCLSMDLSFVVDNGTSAHFLHLTVGSTPTVQRQYRAKYRLHQTFDCYTTQTDDTIALSKPPKYDTISIVFLSLTAILGLCALVELCWMAGAYHRYRQLRTFARLATVYDPSTVTQNTAIDNAIL